MSEIAKVTSIESIKDYRTALCIFGEEAREALSSVEMEIHRTLDWLDHQQKFWKSEIRRREDKVTQAKADLRRRKFSGISGREPDCSEQEKALRIAQRQLEHAEQRAVNVRRWKPIVQRAVEEYETHGRQLTDRLERELPKSIAVLAEKIDALSAYVQMAPPGNG